MKTDILNTTQNPDELRRLAQDLLDKQTQSIHTLENDNAAIQAEKTALEQHIRGQEVMMLGKRLVRTVLIFTESSDQLSRATDRVPGLPASPGYVQ
ncbi:hypothetical protein TUM1881_51640 (plasmid) [Escherichia coli]|nr:hypothetical protein TUM1881_51640 [Escherichia coli]